MHFQRWKRHGDPLVITTTRGMTLDERIWGPIEKTDGCWMWTGATTRSGYGRVFILGRGDLYAHRLIYELLVDQIPDGYEVDHLCHAADECSLDTDCPHRRCVRPDHLEAVTPRVNKLRSNSTSARNAQKTHCPKDHPLSGPNVIWKRRADGGLSRSCRICRNANKRLRHAEKRRRIEPAASLTVQTASQQA